MHRPTQNFNSLQVPTNYAPYRFTASFFTAYVKLHPLYLCIPIMDIVGFPFVAVVHVSFISVTVVSTH